MRQHSARRNISGMSAVFSLSDLLKWCYMNRIKNIIHVLTMKINEDPKRQCHINVAMSIIVCLSAGVMLIMNLMRHAVLMTITSLVLVGGFAATGIMAGVLKKVKASSLLMALILTGVFTIFPISGGNEGFAVLWVLLIPLFSISLFGLKIGLGMNAYFIVLITALFYSPLNKHIVDLYTDNFMHRFPVLFLSDSVIAQFIALSSEFYYKLTRLQVYTDDMTGAYNRKYFIEMLDRAEMQKDDLCISVIDVNGLKETNDSLGHAAGDEMICSVPIFAREAFGKDVIVARTGGDEFAILTYGSKKEIEKKVENMKKHAAEHKGKLINNVFMSVGIACRSEYKDLTPEGLFQTADRFMYEDKAAYYKLKGHDRRHR